MLVYRRLQQQQQVSTRRTMRRPELPSSASTSLVSAVGAAVLVLSVLLVLEPGSSLAYRGYSYERRSSPYNGYYDEDLAELLRSLLGREPKRGFIYAPPVDSSISAGPYSSYGTYGDSIDGEYDVPVDMSSRWRYEYGNELAAGPEKTHPWKVNKRQFTKIIRSGK